MAAVHPHSMGINQKQSYDSSLLSSYENSKISSLQPQAVTSTHTFLSHGISANVGTTWPMPTPIFIFDPAAEITIDLSSTFAHYSNIELTSDNTTINFTNLIQNRATTFYLDITINTATFNSLTLNPTLENAPTLPTTNGERYLLEITAYKTSTEETYFLTGGTLSSGGGSQTPWIQNIVGVGFTLTDAGNITIKNTQTDGSSGNLILTRNDTTPNDGDVMGNIFYNGPTDTAALATWGSINVESLDVSNSTKQGELTINVQHDNSLVPIINYTGDDATFRFSSGVDIVRPNVNGSKELGTSSFFWDDVFSETFTLRGSGGNTTGTARTVYADSGGMVFNMPSSAPVFTHSVNNEIFSLLSNGELEIRTELVNGPTLRLRNNDQTPTDNDIASTILFTGETDTLTEAIYGAIEVTMDDVTSTSKQAQLKIQAQKDNSLLNIFDFTGGDATLRISSAVDVMRPNTDGTKELGNSSFFWDDVFTETLTFADSGGDTSTSKNTILISPAGARFVFNTSSAANAGVQFRKQGTSYFTVTNGGFNHVNSSGSDINNWSAITDKLVTSGDTFWLLSGQTDDSNNSQAPYTAIHHIVTDSTAGSRDGQMQFAIASNSSTFSTNALPVIFDLKSTAGAFQIGFFGVAPVSRPIVTGSKAGNAALGNLINELVNLGLIIDGTT